jgi:hypothetical protein
MKKFETKIRNLIDQEVSFSGKAEVKERLMLSVKDEGLIAQFKAKFAEFEVPSMAKARMREKLDLMVDARRSVFDDLANFIFEHKVLARATASVTAFAMMAVIVLQPFTTINLASAYSETKVQSFEGDVYLVRNGLEAKINKQVTLLPGDQLKTADGSKASIVFPDDSIVRLGNKTEVKINHLNDDRVDTQAEIEIKEGKVWNNLIGLNGEESFFKFIVDNVEGKVTEESTFDIEVTEDYTRVVTLQDTVSLEVKAKEKVVPTVLGTGEMVKVKKDTAEFAYLDEEALNKDDNVDAEWVEQNLQEDEKHVEEVTQKVLKERKREAGVTPGNVFYPLEELQRKTKVAVTKDPVKKEQVKLEIANQKLLEAEVILTKGKKNGDEDAKDLLEEYETTVTEVAKKVDELKEFDIERAEKLNSDLKVTVKSHKKVLGKVLPDSEVFEVKESVKKAELSIAVNETEKKKVEIKNAKNTLKEADELVDKGEDELARQKVKEYTEAIDKVTDEIDALPEEEKAGVIDNLIEAKVESLEKLEEVEKKVVKKVEEEKKDKIDLLPTEGENLEREVKELKTKSIEDLDKIAEKAVSTGDVELQQKVEDAKNAPAEKELIEWRTGGQVIIDEVDVDALKQADTGEKTIMLKEARYSAE